MSALSIEKSVVDMDLWELANLQVSPFYVNFNLDQGYRASNSVSGSRFDAPIKDLPFAIQAFTKSFINDQKPGNVFDIARFSPGVTYRSNDFNEGNANLAIRGFTIGSLAGGNIQILRDGFNGPSIFDFTNISRMEVVKGPSSFLYGQVAPGGIVNIITKSPQAEFRATGSARYGSYNQYRCETDITGPAMKNIYYRLASSYDHDMEYWKPYDSHSLNISPSLLWEPHPRVGISLKYENYSKEEEPQVMQKPGYNTQSGLVPTAKDPNLSGIDVPGLPNNWNSMSNIDFRRSESHGLSSWIDVKASDNWNLRAGYSLQKYEIDALFSGNLGMSNNTTYLQGRRLRRQVYSNDDHTFKLDAAGKYDLGWTRLRLLIGGQYTDRRLERSAGQAPPDTTLGSNPIASPLPLWDLRNPSTWNRDIAIPLDSLTHSRFEQMADYTDKSANAGITIGFLNDRLLLLSGGRYTWTISTDNRAEGEIKSPHPEVAAGMVTPQYGLLYKPIREVSLFLSYSESFVPGTIYKGNVDGTSSPAKATRGYGYDAGVKSDLMNGRISGTLSYFDITNKNILNDLTTTNDDGTITQYSVGSGEQRSNGVEVDVTVTALQNLQLYASYSFMNARITKFSENDEAILAQDTNTLDAAGRANYKTVNRFHNAPLQMSAPHLANLWARYDFSQNGIKGVYCAGGANFVYDQTLLPDGPLSSHQTYALVNAVLGYKWVYRKMNMSADAMGKNLANESYRPSQSTRSRPLELLLSFTAQI